MSKKLAETIWLYTILIMGLGLLALYSATFNNVRVSQDIFYDQFICALLGMLLMRFLSRVDYRKFYDVAYLFYLFNVILLLFVLATGRHALGARRWIELGSLSFQPSELMKLAIIFALGRYLSNLRPTLSFDFLSKTQTFIQGLIIPLMITAVPMFLIFKQPDLGTAILLMGIFFILVFASGLEFRFLIIFVGIGIVLLPLMWHILHSYQKARLLVFLNPNVDPLGTGYTIIQSKIAVGSGQIFGKGWLGGTQNQLNFLPERHTDFIFSVIGEEFGFVGTIFLLYCYFMLIFSGFKIAQQVKDKFGMFVSLGIVSILALQVIINIGMVTGLFPVVGITLPLVSYGRSSFLIFIIMMGFLLNLSQRRTIF